MTNVRKLVARLNASTCRFDVGRGGIPELTPQDIAGALGMVKDELAREVFCAVWWPACASLTAAQLDRLLATIQFAEWRRRADDLIDAQLVAAHARSQGDREGIKRGAEMLEKATHRMWPALAEEVYGSIRTAVVDELRTPNHCEACEGRAETMRNGILVVECPVCHGTGRQRRSNRDRAKAIQRDESTFRRSWRGVYEWTLQRVEDAERKCAREFAKRMAA